MDESDQVHRSVPPSPGERGTLTARVPAGSRARAEEVAPAAPHSRREEILDGAAEMFAEHGYHGSSLRDISGHIGISHSGMLHHFESKDALLDGVIDRLEEHAQIALNRIPELSTDRRALLRGLADIRPPPPLPVRPLAQLDAAPGSEALPRLPPDPPAGDARRRIGERGAPRPVPDGATAEGPRARPGELLRGPRRARAAA